MRGKNTEDVKKSLQAQGQLAGIKLMEQNKKLIWEALLKEKWSQDKLKVKLMSTGNLTFDLCATSLKHSARKEGCMEYLDTLLWCQNL